jgi:excinuclease ABC subunit A
MANTKRPARQAARKTDAAQSAAEALRADRAAARPRGRPPKSSAGVHRAQPAGAPTNGATGDVPWLVIRGAAHNNLRSIDAAFPLGRFTCVTGVSGSGKSSLVNDILHAALARELNGATVVEPGRYAAIEGLEHLDKVIAIDQSPIGRTPRSNPATYIKLFDEIRSLFTKLPDAKLRGYKPGRFSFNVPASRGGGRCEACEGNGSNRVEMDFLADVWVKCPVCEGQRFGRETLQVRYKGKSIADVLNMEVQAALEHFENLGRLRSMLQTLHDVGLDYIQLGQPSTTLSGGEAQRIKLARELVKKPTGRTLYVLDEPTTGLHFEDIRKLLSVLHGFVDSGNTVVVIEHNLDVLKTADWIIDLGPEGGEDGGQIVAVGTPEDVAACAASYTGQALREVLSQKDEVQSALPTAREVSGALSAGAADMEAAPLAGPGAANTSPRTLDFVRVVGAQQHNLKDLTVEFPRNQLTVCTGVSGSGKTSFAIDTVFTEGYRRYVESLSAYARQFLGQMAKPRVDHVEGLSPAICIEQRAAGKSPRSTVGTVTEIYDYMRVLWARVGIRYCPRCQVPIGTQTADEIIARVMDLPPGAPIMILAPVALGDNESYAGLFNRLKASGYTRVRIDGEIRQTAQSTTLDARRKHRVEVVIDRTIVRDKSRGRIAESVEHALSLGNGIMTLLVEEVEVVAEEVAAVDGEVGGSEVAKGETEHVGEDHPTEPASPGDSLTPAAPPPRVPTVRSPAREMMFSQKLACIRCGTSYEELGPNHFSFNSQLGWCETCEGLGVQRGAPAGEIIRHPARTLFDGAIDGWPRIDRKTPLGRMLLALCEHLGVSPSQPLLDWTPEQKRALMFGTTAAWVDGGKAFDGMRFQWRGFFPAIDHASRNSWLFRYKLRNTVTDIPCTTCRGGRLRPDAAAVRLGGRSIVDVCDLPLTDANAFLGALPLDARERQIAGELLKEIRDRLQFLMDVGLHYLTLHRAAPTLSGGEAQRIRLASQIGSGLSGVLYVLDEPTIGLHPRDTRQLINALQKLRNLGNTLLLVEHDRDVIQHADRLLDFGPRAGAAGGQIVAQGVPREFLVPPGAPATVAAPATAGTKVDVTAGEAAPESLTRAYLSGAAAIPVPTNRRPVCAGDGVAAPPRWLLVRGARQNNLRNLNVPIPLGRLTCVTGVSGSGKSSLVNDILWPALANALNHASLSIGDHQAIEVTGTDFDPRSLADCARAGPEYTPLGQPLGETDDIDKVINVDQSPIGTTPSSNPATYTGVFDGIRELFARLPDSKVRGYSANRFSFNRPGGRCEACEGYGQRCIEMHFMPDVWVECEVCHGRRYNPETLEVRFKGHSIADVLELRVAAALRVFENVPKVRRMLQTLADVGLDYVQLGQPAPTLSGGEAQRVKLAGELGKPDTGHTFYVLDEPTTGLHFDDIRKLLAVLHRLADLGNTVVVVEHNLDVLKNADWIIDLGPEAGADGGQIVARGTPEEIARVAGSHTAAALAPILAAGPHETRTVYDAAEHAAREIAAEKAGFGDVGKEVRMPWQVDGRRWHLEQRTSRSETPKHWEPAALEYVVELVQEEGARVAATGGKAGKARGAAARVTDAGDNVFEPTNWNNRASVEITAPGASMWFLHALTGGEWLIEFYFRAPPGTFDWRKLNDELGLKTLDERDDLQAYGDWARVDVRARRDGWDAVVVYVHDQAEIATPAFRRFIRAAVKAYLAGLQDE